MNELCQPMNGERRAAGIASAKKASSKRASEREEMARLIREVDARKKSLSSNV